MANHNWGSGRPGSRIPQRIKDQVRRRDRVCQLQYDVCTGRIEQFDHVIGLAEQGLQRTAVTTAAILQGAYAPCHKVKSERQRLVGIERAKQQRGSLSKRYRDLEPHPGRL